MRFQTSERLWIERKASDIRIQLDKAREVGMPIYPFTDVLVVPKSVMEKYGDEMKCYPVMRMENQKPIFGKPLVLTNTDSNTDSFELTIKERVQHENMVVEVQNKGVLKS